MKIWKLRAVIDLYTNGPLVLYNGATGFTSQQGTEYVHEHTQKISAFTCLRLARHVDRSVEGRACYRRLPHDRPRGGLRLKLRAQTRPQVNGDNRCRSPG
jgi:hypothetical protein